MKIKFKNFSLLAKLLTACCWIVLATVCTAKAFLYLQNPTKFEFTREAIALDDFPVMVVCNKVPYKYKQLSKILGRNVTKFEPISQSLGQISDQVETKKNASAIIRQKFSERNNTVS